MGWNTPFTIMAPSIFNPWMMREGSEGKPCTAPTSLDAIYNAATW